MMKDTIKIGSHVIGKARPPFIIAEMSANHNHSLKHALKIVEAAARCGCDALKIQTYTADTMTIDCKRKEFFIEDKKSLWKGFYLYDLYKKAYTPWEWHKPIFEKCRKLGMVGFSTPFDSTAVDFLESFNVPAYKIASFENTDIPLIKRVASTGKPIIMSTGMASKEEIKTAVKAARLSGCKKLILLKCTSAYPSLPKSAHLKTMEDMSRQFKTPVGLSDHTLGIGVAVASIALGASVIEKHFTLKRADGGVDSAFSIEPDEMKVLVEECNRAFNALGYVKYGPSTSEKKNMHFRRSIFAVDNIKVGSRLSSDNIRVIRPGSGLSPSNLEKVLGKKAVRNISRGTPLRWEHIQ